MAIYEYECSKCDEKFDSKTINGADCPKCGAIALRIFSTFAHFWKAGQNPVSN